MEEITKHYLISGRVQGVGFRAFTQRSAAECLVRGWVRNLADGRVEALACGTAENISRFEAKLRTGPRLGRVDSLLATEKPEPGEFKGFEVRRDGT